MSYDIAITIGGKIKDIDALRLLAEAMVDSECGADYDEGGYDDVLEALDAIEEAGTHLSMAGRGDEDLVHGIQNACIDAGLSYSTSVGFEGEDDHRFHEAFRPEWGYKITAGEGEHQISTTALHAAIGRAKTNGNVDEIEELLKRTLMVDRNPAEFEVAPGLIDELREIIQNSEDEDMDSALSL